MTAIGGHVPQLVFVDETAQPTATPEDARAAALLATAIPALGRWAEVMEYKAGSHVVLRRLDTDGRALRVPIRNIRQALRKIVRTPDRANVDAKTARRIMTDIGHRQYKADAADIVLQVATMGRVMYK